MVAAAMMPFERYGHGILTCQILTGNTASMVPHGFALGLAAHPRDLSSRAATICSFVMLDAFSDCCGSTATAYMAMSCTRDLRISAIAAERGGSRGSL